MSNRFVNEHEALLRLSVIQSDLRGATLTLVEQAERLETFRTALADWWEIEQTPENFRFKPMGGEPTEGTLSTDHSASSYGIPVLVDSEGNAYGPGDVGWVEAPADQRDRLGKLGYPVRQVEFITVLQPGETPWSYRKSPGELPGPWGFTTEEALAEYTRQTGFTVAEWWERGNAVWIIPAAHDRPGDVNSEPAGTA